MSAPTSTPALPRMKTWIEGFDRIANGGVPRGRAMLVAGTAGSAKTVFAAQFLAAGILTGNISLVSADELSRLEGLFRDGPASEGP